jgi:hypothetical protein
MYPLVKLPLFQESARCNGAPSSAVGGLSDNPFTSASPITKGI